MTLKHNKSKSCSIQGIYYIEYIQLERYYDYTHIERENIDQKPVLCNALQK